MVRGSLVSVIVFGLGLTGGCMRSAGPAQPPPEPVASPSAVEELPPPEQEPPPPKPGPCAANGRLWDGKPVDCSYEHAGCCYESAAEACAAASCPAERCLVLESYPAQIACE